MADLEKAAQLLAVAKGALEYPKLKPLHDAVMLELEDMAAEALKELEAKAKVKAEEEAKAKAKAEGGKKSESDEEPPRTASRRV